MRSRAAARRTPILLVFRSAPAAEELHVVGDHVHLAPLGSVLGLPGPILQSPLDQDGVALLLVVGDSLAELAPGRDVEEVHLLAPGAHPIYREPERTDRHPVVGGPQLGISRKISGEDHPVKADHESISLPRSYLALVRSWPLATHYTEAAAPPNPMEE